MQCIFFDFKLRFKEIWNVSSICHNERNCIYLDYSYFKLLWVPAVEFFLQVYIFINTTGKTVRIGSDAVFTFKTALPSLLFYCEGGILLQSSFDICSYIVRAALTLAVMFTQKGDPKARHSTKMDNKLKASFNGELVEKWQKLGEQVKQWKNEEQTINEVYRENEQKDTNTEHGSQDRTRGEKQTMWQRQKGSKETIQREWPDTGEIINKHIRAGQAIKQEGNLTVQGM